jgi:hypothetical protein
LIRRITHHIISEKFPVEAPPLVTAAGIENPLILAEPQVRGINSTWQNPGRAQMKGGVD